MSLREMELRKTRRLISGLKAFWSYSWVTYPSQDATGPGVSSAHRVVVDRIVHSVHSDGTKLLQALSLEEFRGCNYLGFCEDCAGGWESGLAGVRKKV